MCNESLGTCCFCGKGSSVRNILMLDRKGPIPGRGWGCVVCGLPMDGAIAVMCDECVERGNSPLFACKGYVANNLRVPVALLTDRFEHDMSRHPGEAGAGKKGGK